MEEDDEQREVFIFPIEQYSMRLGSEAIRAYREYIGSRLWAERKQRYYAEHPKQCAVCRSPHVDLNHIYYGNYGFEKDEDLIPLCRSHHEALHRHIGVRKDMRYATGDFIEWQRNLLKLTKTSLDA
jgi:hypothetical protein